MGPIEQAIRATTVAGTRLRTPTGRGEFSVADINDKGVVLLLGAQEARTLMTWPCLEGVGPYLAGKGWVRIGSKYETGADPGTLDEYLKGFVNRATGGWVAVLLEHAGVVEVDRSHPARVRLRG